MRVTTLGHVQRGNIHVLDRLLATRLGAAATEHLVRGEHGLMVGTRDAQMVATPLAEVVADRGALDLKVMELAGMFVK